MSKDLDIRRKGGSDLGYKIKERREALRMSQEELASKSGVSRQTISSIENCPDKNMSTKTLEKIAAALGTTLKDLSPTSVRSETMPMVNGRLSTYRFRLALISIWTRLNGLLISMMWRSRGWRTER